MITDETSGVWETWDVFAKANAQKWRPNGVAFFSWGYGSYGRLGQNDTIRRSSPVQIPGTSWSAISAGYHSLATQLVYTS